MGFKMGVMLRSGPWLSSPSAPFPLWESSEHLVGLFNNTQLPFDSTQHLETPSTSPPVHPPTVLLAASPLCLNYAKAVVRN